MTEQAVSLIRTRLGAMMFFEYIIWGAWYVTLTTYLTTVLKFSGTEAGAVFGTAALASLLSPFFVGLVADRFFATERVMATLYIDRGVVHVHGDEGQLVRRRVYADAGLLSRCISPPSR